MEILEQAVKEVSETGRLSFQVRRGLWLALGEWEERDETDNSPRTLTKSLQKRAQLALACAKKVAKIWAAYAPEDKGPQKLVKQGNAYLSGKLAADKLSQTWSELDYMNRTEEERYSAAPMAAIAAERAAAVALYDEFLLEPHFADAHDTDLDPYDWDAAWCASLAWAGQNEDASPGEQKVAELKFWAWYLEQAARLLRMEDWNFPKKAIKAFEEKQELARPVPEEVSLESLADFLGQGEYQYHYRIRNAFNDGTVSGDEAHGYDIFTICRKEEGFCPKCKTPVTKAEFWYTVNSLEAMLPGSNVSVRVLHSLPMFHCPDHPDISFTPHEDYVNPKAALKRYLQGEGRLQALLEQLEKRMENVFQIGEGYLALNGNLQYHHAIRVPANIQGIRWLDSEDTGYNSYQSGMTEEMLEIDLTQFGSHVYFPHLTFEEFRKAFPDRAEVLSDECIQITMERHWVRCRLDGAGNLERVVIQSRFHIEVDTSAADTLTQFLMQEFQLSEADAKAEITACGAKGHPHKEIGVLSNLTRTEALRLCSALRSKGIKCRIMPVPVGEKGDTQLR